MPDKHRFSGQNPEEKTTKPSRWPAYFGLVNDLGAAGMLLWKKVAVKLKKWRPKV